MRAPPSAIALVLVSLPAVGTRADRATPAPPPATFAASNLPPQRSGSGAAAAGSLALPAARSMLRISGFLKLDVVHDTGPYSGDGVDLPNLSLRGSPDEDRRRGVTRLHARESRLAVGGTTDTPAGLVLMYLETDFFAGGSATAYHLRMRHAYVTWRWLLAGQTWSNFLDLDAKGRTVEYNGPTGGGGARRPQLRVTIPLGKRLRIATALEDGGTDYTDPRGNLVLGAQALDALASGSVQQLPELTAQLRFVHGASHLALRGMGRRLSVQPAADRPLEGRGTGYAVGLSARWCPYGRSSVFGQINGGRGIGAFINDLEGQSATFDGSGRRFVVQLGYGALGGFEKFLSERWRASLIGTVSGVALAAEAPVGPEVKPLTTRFGQLFANLLYAPIPELHVAIEYAHLRRETNVGLVGWSHRFQLAVSYHFGG